MPFNNRFLPLLNRSIRTTATQRAKHQKPAFHHVSLPSNRQDLARLKTSLAMLSDNIINNIDRIFPVLKQYPMIKETAGFIVFRDSLYEFLKNSVDAKATYVHLAIRFNQDKTQCVFVIKDNGALKIPQEKIGKYDIKQALFTLSNKKAAHSPCLGGHQIGLAMAAHFVEKYGNGWLTLSPCGKIGAVISIYSSTDASPRQRMQHTGENYAHTIIADITKKLLSEIDPDTPNYDERVSDVHKAMNELLVKFHHPGCEITSYEESSQPTITLAPLHTSSLMQRRLSTAKMMSDAGHAEASRSIFKPVPAQELPPTLDAHGAAPAA